MFQKIMLIVIACLIVLAMVIPVAVECFTRHSEKNARENADNEK